MRTNTNRLIRKANKYMILDLIRQRKKATLDIVQKHTKLSYPTVSKLVNELLSNEILMKDGYADSNGGKPAAYLSLNTNKYFALGIDVEIPTIRFALTDLYGDVIFQHKVDVEGRIEKENVWQQIIAGIEKCKEGAGIKIEALSGIGIGLPGTLDLNKNISINIERIKGWQSVDLIGEIKKKYKVPIYIRNDVHLMALLEKARHENIQSFALVAIRQGVGMAICLEGKLYEGINGNAGFIGHTTIIPDGLQCKCGKKGCLEAYASQEAIIKEFSIKKGISKSMELAEIVALSNEGDVDAAQTLISVGRYLGITIANIINILDIHTFFISGLPDTCIDLLFETVKITVRNNTISVSNDEIEVIKSHYNNETYALGGCYFVIEQFFKKPNLKLHVSQHVV